MTYTEDVCTHAKTDVVWGHPDAQVYSIQQEYALMASNKAKNS